MRDERAYGTNRCTICGEEIFLSSRHGWLHRSNNGQCPELVSARMWGLVFLVSGTFLGVGVAYGVIVFIVPFFT